MRARSEDGAFVSPQGVDPLGLDKLSLREEEVLSLAAAGLLDKQIAAELDITLNTIRTYWTRIRSKMGEVPRSALAVVYAEARAPKTPSPPVEGASWYVDLERGVVSHYGERDIFPAGQLGIEEVMARYHPEDVPRVRALLRAIEEQPLPSFAFTARIMTEHGLQLVSSYVEIVRDEEGKAVGLVGRYIPIMDLTAPSLGDVLVGSYWRDLATNAVTVDAGFCEIFRVERGDPDLYETVLSRFCVEYRGASRTLVEDMIAEGHPTLRRACRLCFEDGTQLWASAQVRVEYESDRPVRALMTVVAYP